MKPVGSIICALGASPFDRVWGRARCRRCAVLAVLLAAPAVSHAQQTRSVDVFGSITAEVNGDTSEWLTIAGGGMDGASAVWSPYAPPEVQMPSHLSEEQAAMMRERITAMSAVASSNAVQLRITGFDPEAERMLADGGLSIEVSPFSADESESVLATNHDAEVSLFHGRGPDRKLYVSAHSAGPDASVEFDRLEVVTGGGRAEGRFAATLCPISALMRSDVVTDDCVPVSGTFETDLIEDGSAGSAP